MPEERTLAAGDGWRAADIVCHAGPGDTPFEESHARLSVAAVLAGSFTYRSDYGRVLMSPGSILLGNRGACFCCAHDHAQGGRCVALQFEPALVEEVACDLRGVSDTGFRSHRLPPSDVLVPLVARARWLSEEPDRHVAEDLALDFLATALRMTQEGGAAPVTLRDEARVTAALALLDRRFREPLTLADLAGAAGVTRYHFLRVFRRVVGVTPYGYLLSRRLAAAVRALRREEGTVLDVALGAGFSDLSDFTRRFRHRFGVTPAAYRRLAKKGRRPAAAGDHR